MKSPSPPPPIPKLRIKKSLLEALSPYKPVKVLAGRPRQRKQRPPSNGLASKLRALSCKVNVPRLKFRVLDSFALSNINLVKFHQKDIQTLSIHQVSESKLIPKSENSDGKDSSQPPIPSLKIRLRKPVESAPAQQGRSLSSILAEIVTKPPPPPAVTQNREIPGFLTPPQSDPEQNILFSTSLSNSMTLLTRFVETEICRDILDEVVAEVHQRQEIASDILQDLFNGLFDSAELCAKVVDDVVQTAMNNVKVDKILKPSEVEEMLAMPATPHLVECGHPDTIEEQNIETKKNQDESDESSIELSDSEFDDIGDITGGKMDNDKTNIAPQKRFEIKTNENKIAKSGLPDFVNFIPDPPVKNISDKMPTKHQELRKRTVDDELLRQNENLQNNRSDILRKEMKNQELPVNQTVKPHIVENQNQERKVPKLVIKPVRKPSNEISKGKNETKTNGESDTKLPPIIVKIPKSSISPKKNSKKETKTPEKAIKNLNITFSKQPKVTVKNLKILPLKKPSEELENSKNKNDKDVAPKISIQTPPPLAVIKNKTKSKSPETVEENFKPKGSLVTVLKMSEIMALKQEKGGSKEELNELERMLEEENRRSKEKSQHAIAKKPKHVPRNDLRKIQDLRNEKKINQPEVNLTLSSKQKTASESSLNVADTTKTLSEKSDADSSKSASTGMQRRNSFQKQREQWVVSDRIKSPSPTPANPLPFVAKKSRPSESVTFSMPPGGFITKPPSPPKPKPLHLQVDDLFSQYFPQVRGKVNQEKHTEKIESTSEIVSATESIAKQILNDLISTAVDSYQTNNSFERDVHSSEKNQVIPARRVRRKKTENLGKKF